MNDISISISTSTLPGEQEILENKPTPPWATGLAKMSEAPRCHARTRTGESCRSAAVKGKRVCRMHGGARGSGAPKGEANGMWKHGGWSNDAVALRREASKLMKDLREKADV
jgi:glucans biosynthesis protein